VFRQGKVDTDMAKSKSRKKNMGEGSIKQAEVPPKELPLKPLPKRNQTAAVLEKSTFPWVPIAVCVLLTLFLILQGTGGKYDSQLCFALGAGVIFIASFMKKMNRALLLEKITPIFILLFAQCLLFFIGLFYGSYPKFALQQFFLNMGGLFIFASLYVYFLHGEKNIKLFLAFFSACTAFISLINIELATSRCLLGIFEAAAKIFGTQLSPDFAVFEENTRITTVLGNPNVFAPIAVLGMFAALWNCGKAGSRRRESTFLMSIAIICGTAFILCFSLGTILAYIPALIAIIIVSKKEHRGSVFLSNVFCLLASFILAFMVFALRGRSILPLLSVLFFSVGFAFVYTHLKPVKPPKIKTNSKTAQIVGACTFFLACTLFLICAFSIHGPYTLSGGGTFRRAVALEPGVYSISVTLDNPASKVSVGIDSMSYAQAALKERTALKTSAICSGESLEFEVPESSAAVFFSFSADADIKIESTEITGSDTVKQLPLHYRLLPEFIVNRLQGLWVNDNAIQRFIFFRDGIRLGMTSPIVGLGGGAFEGGLYSVADYQYETNHVHNEYIQDFIDGGIIGLFLFVALTVFVFRALYKAGRTGKLDKIPNLLPFLLGSMLLIFLHSMLDVDFSISVYRLTALALFALTAASCGDGFSGGKILKNTIRCVLPLTCAVTMILAVGRIHAVNLTSNNITLKSLQHAVFYDPFNSDDYKLSYLINTEKDSSTLVSSQRKTYLDSLENKKLSGDSEYMLANYYLIKPEPDLEKGVKAAERYIREKRVDSDAWDNVFKLYNIALDAADANTADTQKISESVRNLCDYLTELNSTLPKVIRPELAVYTYMRTDAQAQEKQVLADSRIVCDFDQDGVSDIVSGNSGNNVEWTLNVVMQPALYVVKVYQDSTLSCDVLLDGQPKVCEYDSSKGCFETDIFCIDTEIEPLLVRSGQPNSYFTIEKVN
jgi:O-antigen ligase